MALEMVIATTVIRMDPLKITGSRTLGPMIFRYLGADMVLVMGTAMVATRMDQSRIMGNTTRGRMTTRCLVAGMVRVKEMGIAMTAILRGVRMSLDRTIPGMVIRVTRLVEVVKVLVMVQDLLRTQMGIQIRQEVMERAVVNHKILARWRNVTGQAPAL
jgi:hypothetical protein